MTIRAALPLGEIPSETSAFRPWILPVLVALAAAVCPPASRAQGVKAVREVPGAECRKARETADTRAGNLPAVRSAPSSTAPVVGRVGTTVFAVPSQRSSGFVGVLLPDGRTGWLEEAWTAPWPGDTECSVVVLNNGRIGWRAR